MTNPSLGTDTRRRRPLRALIAALPVATLMAVGPAPAASASGPEDRLGWENCGDHICTEYLTRGQTQALNTYIQGTDPYVSRLGTIACLPVGVLIDVLSGGWCSSKFDWPEEAKAAIITAANNNECLQKEYPADRSGDWLTFGVTGHDGWCLDELP